MEIKFANRMANLKASEIREFLKLTENKEIISFAGGLPAPELFPIEDIKAANNKVLDEQGQVALQYATTEGYLPLRKWIAERMKKRFDLNYEPDEILITNGSQQALDFTGKVFLNEGDVVLCESPTYLAAISAFKAYECKFIEVPTDDNGMVIEELEKILNTTENVKIIYAIPDFQNPTGRCWSLERRKALAEISEKHGVVVLEDNPYGELRFEGEHLPAIKSFDKCGNIMFTSTFSKIFCPGYRIGFIAANKEIIQKYVFVKQGADLQCNTLAQMEVAKYLEMFDIDEHIEKIKVVYKKRRDLAVKVMEENFPQGVKYSKVQGGLFTWVTLPEHISARDLLKKCIERNVAYVPGGSFFPCGGNENTFRVNFSNMPEEKIEKGLKIIAEVIKELV